MTRVDLTEAELVTLIEALDARMSECKRCMTRPLPRDPKFRIRAEQARDKWRARYAAAEKLTEKLAGKISRADARR